jgi:hypothetical protein
MFAFGIAGASASRAGVATASRASARAPATTGASTARADESMGAPYVACVENESRVSRVGVTAQSCPNDRQSAWVATEPAACGFSHFTFPSADRCATLAAASPILRRLDAEQAPNVVLEARIEASIIGTHPGLSEAQAPFLHGSA